MNRGVSRGRAKARQGYPDRKSKLSLQTLPGYQLHHCAASRKPVITSNTSSLKKNTEVTFEPIRVLALKTILIGKKRIRFDCRGLGRKTLSQIFHLWWRPASRRLSDLRNENINRPKAAKAIKPPKGNSAITFGWKTVWAHLASIGARRASFFQLGFGPKPTYRKSQAPSFLPTFWHQKVGPPERQNVTCTTVPH